VCDAYLRRVDIVPGYTVAVWRGRHLVDVTELTDAEAARSRPRRLLESMTCYGRGCQRGCQTARRQPAEAFETPILSVKRW
jgi:hypothetical protein